MTSFTLIENYADTQEGSANVNMTTNRKTVVVQVEDEAGAQFNPQATKSKTVVADNSKPNQLKPSSSQGTKPKNAI